MRQQPNFLILMVDQLSGALFRDGPADFLHAPVLKQLAADAVCFDNTYCASPLCAPSRASLMTGTLPSVNQVYDNAAEWPSTQPGFAHLLRAEGYTTVLSGKMHFVGADQLHGFEQRLTTDIYPSDFGWTPDWRKPNERVDWWYHNLSSVTNAGVAVTSNQLEYDDEVCYHAKLKLTQLARQTERTPFCLTVSFTHPHDPYVTRQKYWDLYSDDALPALNVPGITYERQDPHSQRLYDVVDHRHYPLSEQQIRNARRAYFANISYLDEQIGQILTTLKQCQLDDNTIIVFCADHGDMLGERGLWYKMSFFEGSIRVPMFLHAPDRFKPAVVTEPVSTLDLAPTLHELATGASDSYPIEADGQSLVGLAQRRRSLDRSIVAEFTGEGSIDPMLMIRAGRWKFVFCEVDPPQLFDLAADPLELTNLAADPAHANTVKSFTEQVHQRWDVAALRAAVRRSQAHRLLAYRGLRQGQYQPWDYQPTLPAAERYMRNHLDLNELEANARFPQFDR